MRRESAGRRKATAALRRRPRLAVTWKYPAPSASAPLKSSSTGESTITRESNRRHLTVKVNLRGRDLSSFLAEAQRRIEAEVSYDHAAYQVQWGGQFENQRRAQARLLVILPITLALIFLLLYAAFGTLRQAALDQVDNKVSWIPGWGHDRIYNMLANRPDWCVSRQRAWGVPIAVFVEKKTHRDTSQRHGVPPHENVTGPSRFDSQNTGRPPKKSAADQSGRNGSSNSAAASAAAPAPSARFSA